MKNQHIETHEELIKLLEEYNQPKNGENEKSKSQRGRRPKNKDGLITVCHDVSDIKLGIVEMCSVNLSTFRALRNSGFSRIMAPIIKRLEIVTFPSQHNQKLYMNIQT